MTSQGEWFAKLTYCKCEYSTSIPAQKRSHIVASVMPKRWVATGCDDKGSDRRVSSGLRDEMVIEEDVRGTARTVQAFARYTAETRMASFSRWLSTRSTVSSGYCDKVV